MRPFLVSRKHSAASLHPFLAVLAAGLLALGVAGCGGGASNDDGASADGGASASSPTLNMVTVNWIEGLAMSYMQAQVLEDSLNVPVDLKEVQGGGIAFSSVANGDRDFFNEAWLPTTHQNSWGDLHEQLQKLGYTYRGTSGGLVVPAYMGLRSAANIDEYREALDGKIYGIEAGSPTNENVRQVLDQHSIEGFSVVAASGPATWQRLRSAIQDREPIIVTGWKPHWKWSEFDLRYLQNGKTNQSPAYGPPEDIFTVVDNQFVDEFPKDAVCFLKEFEANDQQVGSLMNTFRTRGDMGKTAAAEQWVRNHPEHVTQWLDEAEACAASEEAVTLLPDDATHSSTSESAA